MANESLYTHLASTGSKGDYARTFSTKEVPETVDNDMDPLLNGGLLASLAKTPDSDVVDEVPVSSIDSSDQRVTSSRPRNGRTEITTAKETLDNDREAFWLAF